MPLEEEKLNQNEGVRGLLTEKHRKQLSQILEYGEKMKAEGEKKKIEFRGQRLGQFDERLRYRWEHKKQLEKKYKFFGMKAQERSMFIDKYLLDDMLYSKPDPRKINQKEVKEYKYDDWKKGKIEIRQNDVLDLAKRYLSVDDIRKIGKMQFKEGVKLYLYKTYLGPELLEELLKNLQMKEGCELVLWGNDIGNEGVKVIVDNLELQEGMVLNLSENNIRGEGMKDICKMELKDGVTLDLHQNLIRDEGAGYLGNIKLKYGVTLNVCECGIGDEGIIEMVKNLKLQEGVRLDLHCNNIGDKGAQAIMDYLEPKNGVSINLQQNHISPDMWFRLKRWQQENRSKGILFNLEYYNF